MTVQDIIDELNDHGFTDTGTPRKVAMINDTIQDIASREPWPFLEKEVTLSFDGSSPTPINVPSDFKAVLSVVDPATGLVVRPERLDTLEKTYATSLTLSGVAQFYYFLGGTLRFVKIPAAGSTLRMRYLSIPQTVAQADLEPAIALPARHHRAIVLGTLFKLYDMEDDPELANRFETEFENRIETMRADLWMRQYDEPDRVQVVDYDLYDLD